VQGDLELLPFARFLHLLANSQLDSDSEIPVQKPTKLKELEHRPLASQSLQTPHDPGLPVVNSASVVIFGFIWKKILCAFNKLN